MRYVIYGAGAVGGVIGARLYESGREVVLVGRGPHLEVLRSRGLCYRDPAGERLLQIPAVEQPGSISWDADDVVMLAVKSQDTEGAIRELARTAPRNAAIVCAQNGVDNERVALRRFPRVYAMCVMMPATHLEPGIVEADSYPVVGVLDLGRYPGGVDETAERIATDLSDSGFRSQTYPEAMRWKYEKLLLSLNTAVRAMCGPDALASSGLWREIEDRLRSEALACFAKAGIGLPGPEERAERWDGAITRQPIAGSKSVAGSGWQSLVRGTGSSEADHVNGEVVLLGRLHDVATPANETVTRLADETARLRRPPGSVTLAQIAEAIVLANSADTASRR
jgi:2-dehydropantoate 2-reductase